MNKQEFLNKLAIELGRLPKDEVEDIIAYYNEYFDEAGPENEEATFQELGNPVKIATQIKADYAVRQLDRMPKSTSYQRSANTSGSQSGQTVYMEKSSKGIPVILWVILGIFAAPVALPAAIAAGVLVLVLFGTLGALFLALLVCVAALFGAGIVSIVAGAAAIFIDLPGALLAIGFGISTIGVMALLGLAIVVAGRALFRWLAGKINKSRQKHAVKKEEKAKEENQNE